MRYIFLRYFLIQEVLFIANVKHFTPKSVMNKPQSEGKVNSRLYSRSSTLFSNKKTMKHNC